jgi:hypothetical protein
MVHVKIEMVLIARYAASTRMRMVMTRCCNVQNVFLTGESVVADEYVSAMPVDVLKRLLPRAWSTLPYFLQLDELEGIPVINLHLWFDRKLIGVDHLCFSRSPLLSVYADMSRTCREYQDDRRSMLELVFAPCSPIAGGKVNWIAKTDEEIIAATMAELERIFPTEVSCFNFMHLLRSVTCPVVFFMGCEHGDRRCMLSLCKCCDKYDDFDFPGFSSIGRAGRQQGEAAQVRGRAHPTLRLRRAARPQQVSPGAAHARAEVHPGRGFHLAEVPGVHGGRRCVVHHSQNEIFCMFFSRVRFCIRRTFRERDVFIAHDNRGPFNVCLTIMMLLMPAVLAGKLAAEVIAERAVHEHTHTATTTAAEHTAHTAAAGKSVMARQTKVIENAVLMRAANAKPRSPVGLQGMSLVMV